MIQSRIDSNVPTAPNSCSERGAMLPPCLLKSSFWKPDPETGSLVSLRSMSPFRPTTGVFDKLPRPSRGRHFLNQVFDDGVFRFTSKSNAICVSSVQLRSDSGTRIRVMFIDVSLLVL